MKHLIIMLVLSFSFCQANAQKLSLKLGKKSQALEIFNKVSFSATINNDTGKPIRLFRNHLTSFGGVVHTWTIFLDGKEVKSFPGHAQDTNTGFRASNFRTIPAGGEYITSGYSYTLDKPGEYEITFVYSQNPNTVNMNWGETGEAKSLALQLSPMKMKESYKFTIDAPEIKPFVAIEPTPKQCSKSNRISNFSQAISDPSQVFNLTLNFSDVEITDINQKLIQVSKFKNLRVLDIYLGENDVTLPKELGEIPLQRFTIRSSKRKCIFPEGFLAVPSLTHFNTSSVKFEELPDFLAVHTTLKSLAVFGAGFKTLPDWIGDLSNLEEMNFSQFEATKIPASFVKLTKLKKVILTKNKITKLEHIFNSPDLEELTVQETMLNEIDPEIGKLQKLDDLKLSNNKLVTIPKEIYDMVELDMLYLDRNQLTSLPSSGIDKLKELYYLELTNNQLTTLPEGISTLRIRYFYGKGNKWKKATEYKSLKKAIKGRKAKFYVD